MHDALTLRGMVTYPQPAPCLPRIILWRDLELSPAHLMSIEHQLMEVIPQVDCEAGCGHYLSPDNIDGTHLPDRCNWARRQWILGFVWCGMPGCSRWWNLTYIHTCPIKPTFTTYVTDYNGTWVVIVVPYPQEASTLPHIYTVVSTMMLQMTRSMLFIVWYWGSEETSFRCFQYSFKWMTEGNENSTLIFLVIYPLMNFWDTESWLDRRESQSRVQICGKWCKSTNVTVTTKYLIAFA